MIKCRERHERTVRIEQTTDALALAASLRDQACHSARNVVVLSEQIAGRRLAESRPSRVLTPVDRWLEAHGQAAQRALTGFAELSSPLSVLALWTELTDRWLDANITLAEAWTGPFRS